MAAKNARFHIRKSERMKGKRCRKNRERERERERRVVGGDYRLVVVSSAVALLAVMPPVVVSSTMRSVASWV